MKKTMIMMAVALMSVFNVCAQKTKVEDKELMGGWTMQ